MNNLVPPDQRVSDAVDVRQELDLRIGQYKTMILCNLIFGVNILFNAHGLSVTKFDMCHFQIHSLVFMKRISNESEVYGNYLIPSSYVNRSCVHTFPNPSTSEGVSRCIARAAHQLRQLSVPYSWFCCGEIQAGAAVCAGTLLED